MQAATMTLDRTFRAGKVNPRLFGSFVEHMGRCVYTGIYEPGHPTADASGFRQDVVQLVRELAPSIVRYPGGNFLSGYRWEDGIGPLDQRPRRLDLAWRAIESNAVGIDEFIDWCAATGVEPMLGVNLGTRGVQEAVDLLEYCNHREGTALSDLRRANGHPEPHGVSVWCLGNELDGPWQVGHKTAPEYARLAAETARAMRMVDPTIELVACGSSNTGMPTFAAWEATVLEQCYELVDYVSLHNYYQPRDGDLDSFLACAVDLELAIKGLVATADHVGARLKSAKQLKLSVDEWNVWYQQDAASPSSWEWASVRPLIEDRYNVTDAVVVGTLLITLLQHADRVGIACQAQLVNVIAPIMTEPGGRAWRQTIFHPFADVARWARGDVLQVHTRSPSQPTSPTATSRSCTRLRPTTRTPGALCVFAVNRSRTEAVDLKVDVRSFAESWVLEATTLRHDEPDDPQSRCLARPRRSSATGTRQPAGRMPLRSAPEQSWNVFRLTVPE
jgi:alpha-N-arabinofuranosidase